MADQNDSDAQDEQDEAKKIIIDEDWKSQAQAEKDKLQLIIDSMEYGISIHDKDYNILYQSHPSKVDGAYHTGEKCYRAYEGRDEVCEDCPMIKAFKDGKSHATERKLVSKTGKVIFLENTIDPMKNDRGEIISCVEVFDVRIAGVWIIRECAVCLSKQFIDGFTHKIVRNCEISWTFYSCAELCR